MKISGFKPVLFQDLRNYNKEKFTADIMAGIIVGIVALPLAIAFGIASGVTPEKGIITAIVAGFAISLFGGSKVQIGGPTGAFIVIIYGIIQEYGLEGLAVATIMAGAFLVLLGLFRLGTIIRFIPYPIVVGFTSGIALTIFTTQIKDLLGLQMAEVPADFISKWVAYVKNIGTTDLWTATVGIVSIIIIALTPKVSKKVPGSLVAIVVMTLLCLLLESQFGISVDTIGDRFKISSELPAAEMPAMNWEAVKGLVQPAITIAVLGAIESLLSATVADGVTGQRHNSNQELIGQGIANILAPMFGGIPATGAIARTMTNINNGGKTPISGIIHAAVLLLIFLFLMPYAQYIPMSCLAGVLVIVSYNMSGWRTLREMANNPKSDVVVLWLTFTLTVVFDLTIAIEVGIILACFMFMKRMTETTHVSVLTDEIEANAESDFEVHNEENLVIPDGVEVYEIDGPFFFGIANKFDDVMASMSDKPKVRIIRMRRIPFIDSTGIHNLRNLISMSHKEDIKIILSGVNDDVRKMLERNGFNELVGKRFICPNINVALEVASEEVNKK
ncbi:MAG: sodium-independent anion transporter [Phocaeicola plebeius]|uniref:Sodium-independent anion transporter n=1 Tax=Phocaeicola plebeius TaxID=310297 RepID=A0A854C576_9BACT|nr:MAG: sodium-independent anion transporter [Phocaeicola plebeius]